MDSIVMPEKWHHLCVAMDGASNTLNAVSVRKYSFVWIFQSITINNFQDGDILDSEVVNEKVHVESDHLYELKAENCSNNQEHLCVNSVGTTLADLDVWENALTTDEMTSWTTCR